MPWPLTIILWIVALLAGLFALGVFVITGGVERLVAAYEVSRRGYAADRDLSVPGFSRFTAPASWHVNRHGRPAGQAQAGSDGAAGSEQVEMASDHDLRVDLVLGQFFHAAGESWAGAITVYARGPDAPAWTVASGVDGSHDPIALRWRRLAEPPDLEVYVPEGSGTETRPVEVLVHDPVRRLRVHLRTTSDVYSRDQAITIAGSIITGAIIDEAALARAVEARASEIRTRRTAATMTLRALESLLGRTEPLRYGVQEVNPGIVIWVGDLALHAYLRVGTIQRHGRPALAAAEALRLDEPRLGAVLASAPMSAEERRRGGDLIGLWREDDSLAWFGLRERQIIAHHRLGSALQDAVAAGLSADEVEVWRYGSFYLPDQQAVLDWFRVGLALREAAQSDQPLWRE